MDREKAEEYIEGMVGCYTAAWREWSDEDILQLYIFVCIASDGEVTQKAKDRVGI